MGMIFFLTFYFSGGISQPIRFNHAKHKAQGFACTVCHTTVEEAPWASLPGVETCMGCHSEPLTQSREEEKILDYAKRGEEIPWKRLFQVPPHVYFSHRRHVALGGIACVSCHGDMENRNRPPRSAPISVSMERCLQCHKENKISVGCVSCHR